MAPSKRSDAVASLMFYIDVADVDAALAAVEAAGGRRLSDRMPIPSVGWMAYFEDTEGNRVGVFEADDDAPMPEAGMP